MHRVAGDRLGASSSASADAGPVPQSEPGRTSAKPAALKSPSNASATRQPPPWHRCARLPLREAHSRGRGSQSPLSVPRGAASASRFHPGRGWRQRLGPCPASPARAPRHGGGRVVPGGRTKSWCQRTSSTRAVDKFVDVVDGFVIEPSCQRLPRFLGLVGVRSQVPGDGISAPLDCTSTQHCRGVYSPALCAPRLAARPGRPPRIAYEDGVVGGRSGR